MSALDSLTALARDAQALANGDMVNTPAQTDAETEVARQMQICNACRYCEGFCAVFPAMTRRLSFGKADVHFLANLCHNCGACLHACQYAPPHEFAVNVPQAMATVRGQTYADYAWPPALGALYRRNGLTLSVALAAGLALFLLLALAMNGTLWGMAPGANFYSVFPHNLLVGLFAPVFLFAVLALTLGVRRFWREVSPATSAHTQGTAGPATPSAPLTVAATEEALGNVATLKYLDGGHGQGCHNDDDAHTLARRRAHHLTFYGFLLCFAATSVATLYHYVLDLPAPYALPSLPKLLGVTGGVMLVLGTVGLFRLNRMRHPLHGDTTQQPMDLGFIALLFLTSSTGLALWLATGTAAMPTLLAVHLGAVMALFATLPYGKFAHSVFRTAALLRHNVEKRLPNPLALGDD
jgi:citrate/tricarballylate utilization protein